MSNANYIKDLPRPELQEFLKQISTLSPNDLHQIMSAVSGGLIDQREQALRRSVDMESAVGNLIKRKITTKETYQFVRDEFIKPYERNLRMPGLIETLNKRIGNTND